MPNKVMVLGQSYDLQSEPGEPLLKFVDAGGQHLRYEDTGFDDGTFRLYDPAKPRLGSFIYDANGNNPHYAGYEDAPTAWQQVGQFAVSAGGMYFGLGAMGGDSGATAVSGMDLAADTPGFAGAWSSGGTAVADAAAVSAAPTAASGGAAAAPAAASSGWSLPTLTQIGQGIGVATGIKGLTGGGGSPSAPRPGVNNGAGYGVVPMGGYGVVDNGTTGGTSPLYFGGGPGLGSGGAFLPSSTSGGALSSSTVLIGAAILAVAILALGH